MRKLGGFLLVVGAALTFAPAAQPSVVQDVRTLRQLVNATRAQHSLPPLRFVAALDRSAILKAEAIRRCSSFSHTPCGTPFSRTFQQAGYSGASIAENLGWGTGPVGSPSAILAAWMRSPAHRANLLSRRWRDGGVASVSAPSLFGASGVRIWVLQFGRR